MFIRSEKNENGWVLFNNWGHALHLPFLGRRAVPEVAIGTLGTRVKNHVPRQLAKNKTELMTKMLAALRRPLYLLDVRRDGVGAQGSWSPREFASVIPGKMGSEQAYDYCHLPCLAPSLELLDDFRHGGVSRSWSVFRRHYIAGLSPERLDLGRAFVEAAAVGGGLAVFICAEPRRSDFDALSPEEQDEAYCHRYSLVARIAQRLHHEHRELSVKRVDLDMGDFIEQWQRATAPWRRQPEVLARAPAEWFGGDGYCPAERPL